MNKKKGFTLIELLAIIVILAIIAVITVPLILNIINDAQKNASIDSAYGYKSALEKYYMKKVVENTENELPNGYKNISELPEDFIVSGEVPSDGWVKLKKGLVDKFSLKYDEYVVTMDNDKNVTSEKLDNIYSHVTDDYQEIEYLESTGTQYIDTGYKPNGSTKVEILLETKDIPTSNKFFYGSRNNVGNSGFACGTQPKLIGAYGSNNEFNVDAISANKKYRITQTNELIVNNNVIYSYNKQNFSGSYNFLIFAVNNGTNGVDFKSNYKFYDMKIYDDGVLTRYFVPVIRKSDNKPGMLDLANKTNNLFNPYNVIKGRQDNGVVGYESGTSDLYVSNNTIYLTTNTTWRGFTSDFIEVSSRDYHINVPSQSGMSVSCSQYDANKQFIKKATLNTQLEENCKYIRFTFTFENAGEYQVSNIMLNEGTTALPYEPYGYKFYTNAGTDEFITGPEI